MRSINIVLLTLSFVIFFESCSKKEKPGILVFTKTEAFRHESIPDGIEMMKKLGDDLGIPVFATEDSEYFTEKNLKQYAIVTFLSTTGDILNDEQQYEFKRFIQAGGAFLGIHAAADTEYDWPWYNKLVGAYFESHPNNPNVRDASIDVIDKEHISCSHLPDRWDRTDEWYNYKSINSNIKVLLNLDETSYEGGTNGEDHPIAWYHEFDGGKSFYTGGGHTSESFTEGEFVQHIRGAIEFLIGEGIPVDYSMESVQPAENRFQKVVFVDNLNEPMELELLPDGDIVFIQRDGDIKITDPETSTTKLVQHLEVNSELEDGLLGMALDPDYARNNWMYLFYSHPNIPEQRLSRFSFNPESDTPLTYEKILLKVPVQRDECCHSAGSMEFDRNGNLYVSLGDNTNPHESSGYAPIDNRPGRGPFDALKSSGNTNDLRGKILRIKPEIDGTYTIPEGNLFPSDGSEGRPEIYVMGCRNPYRFSLDMKDDRLFWGEVGPDADKDSEKYGPRGYDEVNMAKEAGNFGWPLLIADNKPYKTRDFRSDETGDYYNPLAPVNTSPRNTGMKTLPPAQEAMIYYPYAKSDKFPDFGSGGRNAMAGPVFYADDFTDSEASFPSYYDKKLFIYEWMRGWIKAVTFDDNGNYQSHEDFLPSLKWNNLIDVVLSPEGDMYMLEYGTGWFTENPDARLSRLKYIKGNRTPNANVSVDKTKGAVPMTVQFDASESIDPDGDEMVYEWNFGDGTTGEGESVTHTYSAPGNFLVNLIIKDLKGESSSNQLSISAGNEPPEISLDLIGGNRSFYLPGQTLEYKVNITDMEDGTLESGISEQDVIVTMDFLKQGYDIVESAMGHEALSKLGASSSGYDLISSLDCKACHKEAEKSIGPAYIDVSNKYKDQKNAISYLSDKIISGGGGVWGETAMAAHPDLTSSDAQKMATYILSLADKGKNIEKLPVAGSYTFTRNPMEFPEGSYVITASYTDKGAAGVEGIASKDILVLKSPILASSSVMELENATAFKITKEMVPTIEEEMEIVIANHEAVLVYEEVDFTGINSVNVMYAATPGFMGGGNISFHLDDHESEPIGTADLPLTQGFNPVPVPFDLKNVEGKHKVILKFNAADEGKSVASVMALMLSS